MKMTSLRDGEILGLHGVTNRRRCVQHQCCGAHVCINDTVSFKLKMVEIGEEKELQMAIKAVVVRDGTE